MKCAKIRILLPEYAGGELDNEAMLRVKNHLASCPVCSDALAFNRKYLKVLSGLKREKAPSDLLAKIHREVDSEAADVRWPVYARRIAEVLFRPLRIKIPMEALGLILVSAVIYFLYAPDQYLKKSVYTENAKADSSGAVKSMRPEDRKPPVPVYRSRDDGIFAKKDMIAGKNTDSHLFRKEDLTASKTPRAEKSGARDEKRAPSGIPEAKIGSEYHDISLAISTHGVREEKNEKKSEAYSDDKSVHKDREKAHAKMKPLTQDRVSRQYPGQYAAKKSAQKDNQPGSASWNNFVQDIKALIKKHNGIIIRERFESGADFPDENRVHNLEVRIAPENYGPLIDDLNKFGRVSRGAQDSKSMSETETQDRVYIRIKTESVQSK